MEFSTATNIGQRDSNQDFYGVGEDCFCVADGHGHFGDITAKSIVETVIWNDLKPPFKENILALFAKLDSENRMAHDFGSTVSAVWYKNGKFIITQCGDSPVFFRNNGEIYHLVGHNVSNATNPDIKKLKKMGVAMTEKYQVCPQNRRWLQLTRSIGDISFGEQVSKVPDILEVEADALLICSDGFNGGVDEVKKLFDMRATAGDCIKNQNQRGILDNITAIIVYNEK